MSNTKTVTLTLDLDEVEHLMLWVSDASQAMTMERAGGDPSMLGDARAYETMTRIYDAFHPEE